VTRVARWLLATVLLGQMVGCGIPDETRVVTRGPGPAPGLSSGEDNVPIRSTRDDTTDRAKFVANYLSAAAGEPESALEHVRDFLAPGTREGFKPPQEILVVRLVGTPLINPGVNEVELRVQQVGTLTRNGIMEPPRTEETRYSLVIAEVEGRSGLFVTKAPPVMLLSDTALETFYERRPIYFWNVDRTALLPDIRFLPRTVPREGQPTQIINWLTAGPSPWLDGAAEALPEGTKAIGNVPAVADGKLQINLTGAAAPPEDAQAVDRLGAQLMWSLRPNLATELELKIEHQVRRTFSGTGYLASNPAYRVADVPERFCVFEGQIRRLRDLSPNAADPVPVVDGSVNRNVRFAALGRGGPTVYAALVVSERNETVLRVGVAARGSVGSFSRAVLRGPVSRPVWAVTPADGKATGGMGLVASGGRLYGFFSNAVDPAPVDWPSGPSGIDTVAVAPDGHRIAVVAGGRLYLSVVTVGNDGLRASPPRQVRTLLRDLTAVDWSSESSLVVSGVRPDTGRVALMDVSIDGASQVDRLSDLGNVKVSYLAAYPANPIRGAGDADAVAYVANNLAYDAFSDPQRIDARDVSGPVRNAGAAAPPTAPFFLE
jgi:Lipoprotein LpqB beta-propeller domain